MQYRTVVVTGPKASGKTTAVNQIAEWFRVDLGKYAVHAIPPILSREGFEVAAQKLGLGIKNGSYICRGIVSLRDAQQEILFIESEYEGPKESRHTEFYSLSDSKQAAAFYQLIHEIAWIKDLETYPSVQVPATIDHNTMPAPKPFSKMQEALNLGYEKGILVNMSEFGNIPAEELERRKEEWRKIAPVDLEHADPQQMEEALTVPGFLPGYPISEVISKYLSDIYEATEIPGRYNYKPSPNEMGVIVYDYDRLVFSYHSSDPAGGKLLDAYGLLAAHGRKTESQIEAENKEPLKRRSQAEIDADVAKRLKAAKGDITPEIEAAAKAANDLAAQEDPTLRSLTRVQNTLDRAREYGLEAEVILWALYEALPGGKSDLEARVAECLEAGLSEWDV